MVKKLKNTEVVKSIKKEELKVVSNPKEIIDLLKAAHAGHCGIPAMHLALKNYNWDTKKKISCALYRDVKFARGNESQSRLNLRDLDRFLWEKSLQ